MIRTADATPERLLELLADRATDRLTAADAAEMNRLLERWPSADPDALDRLTAELAVGPCAPLVHEALPAAVDASLRRHIVVPLPRRRFAARRVAAALGVAAGLALLALAGWRLAVPRAPSSIELLHARESLVRTAADVRAAPLRFHAADASPTAIGQLVWSDERREGYVTFEGLPATGGAGPYRYRLWAVQGDALAALDVAAPRIDLGSFEVAVDDCSAIVRVSLPDASQVCGGIIITREGVSVRSEIVAHSERATARVP